MKKLTEFKKGDVITKIEPRKYMANSMSFIGSSYEDIDTSYIGEKIIFKGIANGMAYVTCFDYDGKKEERSIKICLYEDGWDYYVDPKKL